MNLPTLCTPLDGPLGVLSEDYVPGSHSIKLDDVSRIAAQYPSTSSPLRFIVLSSAGEPLCQFITAGMPVGNSISVGLDPFAEYDDVALPANSMAVVTASAAAFREIHVGLITQSTAITTLQNTVSGVSSVSGRSGAVTLSTSDIAGLGTIATHAAGDYLTPNGSGSGLTGLNASELATGTVPAARLAGGTPSATTYLRGDGQWATPPSPPAPISSVAGRTGSIVLSTADVAGLAPVAASGSYLDLSNCPTLGTLASQNGTFSGTSSGTNTGDQTSITGQAGTVATIAGRIVAGSNVTLSGAGTAASPYSIAATGGGSATPGGTGGQLQYNNNGTFGGAPGLAILPSGSLLASGTIDEGSTTPGVQLGYGSYGDSPRALFCNGVPSQSWQVDNLFGTFRWFTPNATLMTLDASGTLDAKGGFRPPQRADGDAAAITLFYSTTQGKLAFKDPGGTVHYLY